MSQCCKLLYYSCSSFLFGIICVANSAFAQYYNNLEGFLSYPLNKSFVIYDYANNVDELNSLHTYITQTLTNPNLSIRKIQVTGYSSPEGTYAHNKKLAQERAENLTNYLRPFFTDKNIDISYVPEDWTGLVEALTKVSYPEIDAVRSIAQSSLTAVQKDKKLKKLPRRIYKDLCQNYFPLLRRATLTIYCEQKSEDIQQTEAVIPYYKTESEQEVYVCTQQNLQNNRNAALYQHNIQNSALADRYGHIYHKTRRQQNIQSFFYNEKFTPTIAIGTNLLQWAGFHPDFTHATAIPNIYAEYYFRKHWSVKGTFAYCNWSYDKGKRFQGISSYSIEPRFWFQADSKFRGAFFGIYAQLGDYNQKCEEQNYTGKYHSEGISAGYLLPIYKGLAVEVSLRAGYRHASVKKYKMNEECSSLCRTYPKNEITITGSCLNLIYRF